MLEGEGVAPGGLGYSVALFSGFATLADKHPLVRALDVHERLGNSRVEERRHGGTSLQERNLVGHLEMMKRSPSTQMRSYSPSAIGNSRTSAWIQRIARISSASLGSASVSASGQRTVRASTAVSCQPSRAAESEKFPFPARYRAAPPGLH